MYFQFGQVRSYKICSHICTEFKTCISKQQGMFLFPGRLRSDCLVDLQTTWKRGLSQCASPHNQPCRWEMGAIPIPSRWHRATAQVVQWTSFWEYRTSPTPVTSMQDWNSKLLFYLSSLFSSGNIHSLILKKHFSIHEV